MRVSNLAHKHSRSQEKLLKPYQILTGKERNPESGGDTTFLIKGRRVYTLKEYTFV